MLRRIMLCVAAVCAVGGAVPGSASAQEEWPVDPTGRFVQVQEGLLNTTTGLVWGFGADEVNAYLRGHGTGMSWEFAQMLPVLAPDGSVTTYPEFSNWFFDRTDADWRLPAIEEMKAVYQAGLINYLDASPLPGFQSLGLFGGFDPPLSTQCWSGSKSGVFTYPFTGEKLGVGWWLDFKTGEADKLHSSKVNYVPVRGAPPAKGKGRK